MRYIFCLLLTISFCFFYRTSVRSQSLVKLKQQALNTSSITLTSDDSVISFHLVEPGKQSPKALQNRRYWWYGSSNLHSTQGGYAGRLLDGMFMIRSREGDLLEQGLIEKGIRTGEWRSWYPGGDIKGVYQWKDSRLHGDFEEYRINGQLLREGRYKKGSLHGRVREYLPEGGSQVIRYRIGEPVLPKEKKEQKRFQKAKEAWQKAFERAKKINFLKRKNKDAIPESSPVLQEGENQKKLEKEQRKLQREKKEKRSFLRWPFHKKEEDAPQS